MKIAKKIIVSLLCVIISLSVCSFPSFAATKSSVAPKFSLVKISESGNEFTARLTLIGGNFVALDITVECSGNIKGCTKFAQTNEFKNFASNVEDKGGQIIKANNPSTGKVSVSTTIQANSTMPLYDITISKKTADPIKDGELKVKIENSESILSGSAVNTTAYATASFSYAEINKNELKINYKDKAKLEYSGTYDKSNVEWKSSNEKVATVDQNGNVVAMSKGTAEISVETKDGMLKDVCKVTVKYSVLQWIIVYILFGWIWYVK